MVGMFIGTKYLSPALVNKKGFMEKISFELHLYIINLGHEILYWIGKIKYLKFFVFFFFVIKNIRIVSLMVFKK